MRPTPRLVVRPQRSVRFRVSRLSTLKHRRNFAIGYWANSMNLRPAMALRFGRIVHCQRRTG
jgi:hypothetical protein